MSSFIPLFRSIVLGFTCLFTFSQAWAQVEIAPRLMGMGGISIRLGTYVNQVGIIGQLAYVEDFIQVNGQVRLTYNFTQLGPRPPMPGWEVQTSLGAVVAYGPPHEIQPFLSPVSHQMGRRYATGYAWTYYWDQMETSQWTATFAQHINDLSLISENDAYTGFIDDKYRTGTLGFFYRYEGWEFGLNTLLWTGNTRSEGVKKVKNTDYPGRYGYKDLSEATYGDFSHGILALQAKRLLPYSQVVQGQIGIDSEYIRHFLQNRLIHDMAFVPGDIVKAKNPHVPMLTPQGNPFLYNEGQKVKAPHFYFNLGLNPTLFY